MICQEVKVYFLGIEVMRICFKI